MKNKIIDCFTFFNELDLLEIRLEYLFEKVDYFVIVEANMGFSGKAKSLILKDNWERFEKYASKIIYHPIEMANFKNSPKIAWLREEFQRNQIKNALEKISLSSDDVILIGDVDEIPNEDTLESLQKKETLYNPNYTLSKRTKAIFDAIFNGDKRKVKLLKLLKKNNAPVTFSMMNCFFFVNFKEIDASWFGTVAIENQLLQYFTIEDIRKLRNYINKTDNAGWHFSYLGGKEKYRQKLQNFSHQEYNKPEVLSDEFIDTCIEKGYSLANYSKGRLKIVFKKFSIEEFPLKLKNILQKFDGLSH